MATVQRLRKDWRLNEIVYRRSSMTIGWGTKGERVDEQKFIL